MSNRSLRNRIADSLVAYRGGKAKLADLRETVVMNGRGLEMMPYRLVKEINHIEYLLTVAQFDDDDGFAPRLDEALGKLQAWLEAIPVED